MAMPKLRFKEFDEDWTALKYEDILNIKYGKDHKKLNSGNIPVFGTGGVMRYVDQFLHDGESILIGRKGTIDSPKYVNEKFWTVDTLFYTEIKEQAVPKFVYQHALQVNWLKLNEATGVPSLNTKSINNVAINLPPLKEQTKIATFLTTVDTKIDELTQKHELLSEYKKGMMQQIFSQKLRFKADDGSDFEDWEETNLGEVCSHFKSGKSITSRNISTTGKFAVYGGNGLRGYTDSFTHEGKFILVGRQGALCGNVNVVDGNNYISEHAIAIQANKNNSTDWLAYWLDKMKLNRFSESSAQAGLAVNKLVKFKIELPSLPEQTKIANFLTAIDQKIDNVAEQIDHAKTWKKGLLQQMFV
ncbi:MAG: restriction endonuclease subunit S [Psychrobacter celer]